METQGRVSESAIPRSGLKLGINSIVAMTSLCMFLSAQADADDSTSIYDLSLSELLTVEIASLFEEDQLYVGSSVSKVTDQQWRKRGAEKTFDAIAHLPGIYVSEYIHGQLIPTFRGLSGPDQYNSFLVLLDGIPLNNYSSSAATYGTPNFALGNLESIELIRGPGSTLYGADAYQGVVSLSTWDPEEDQLQAFTDVGSFGYYQGTLRFRFSLANDLRFITAISTSGVDNEEIGEEFHAAAGSALTVSEVTGEYRNYTATQKIHWGEFKLSAYYSKHDVTDSFGSGEVIGSLPNGHHTDGVARMSAYRLSHLADIPWGWQLESSAHYVVDRLLGSFGLGNVGGPPEQPTFDWDSEDKRRGGNFLLKKPLADSLTQILFGYNYDHISVPAFGAAERGVPAHVKDANRELHGVLAQVEQRLFDNKLQVIVGARHDRYSDFGEHTSPRFALIYHPISSGALKFLYGNAFRAPSVNEQSDNGIVQGGGDALKPETINTYEVIWMHNSYDENRDRFISFWCILVNLPQFLCRFAPFSTSLGRF